MYSYTIWKTADETAFIFACRVIEGCVNRLKKESLLEDVDGTQIQIYYAPEGEIKVVNDYEVDAVYVDSEVELPCFQVN